MSQYEEKGIAHFFVCRQVDQETLLKEYRQARPDSDFEPEIHDDMISIALRDAILIEYADGAWDYI